MLASRHQKQLTSLLNWLVIALIIWVWAQFALNRGANNDFETSTSYAPQNIIPSTQNNASIAEYHIFGSAQQLYDIPLSQTQTSLDFTLNGTMSSTDETQGMAYITSAQGIQNKFKAGDKIFDVATLKEIYKTYVVIQHNGKNERLQLSESSQMVRSNKNTNTLPKTAKPAYLKHLNGNKNRDWQQMMEQQQFDPNKISSIVGNINIVADQTGSIRGLRVSNLAAGDLLSKHGLKSNDIITAINGNQVSSKNMLTIRQTLEKSPNATVTIKRNGKIQNIQINLKDI